MSMSQWKKKPNPREYYSTGFTLDVDPVSCDIILSCTITGVQARGKTSTEAMKILNDLRRTYLDNLRAQNPLVPMPVQTNGIDIQTAIARLITLKSKVNHDYGRAIDLAIVYLKRG